MDLEVRPVEERNYDNDKIRIEKFSGKMLEKWQKGRKEHGRTVIIDPIEEAQMECVDIANYAMELNDRLERLQVKVGNIRQMETKEVPSG